ncbi:MAG TPA: sensor histidine kinase [Acidobacteriaceae bacterium]
MIQGQPMSAAHQRAQKHNPKSTISSEIIVKSVDILRSEVQIFSDSRAAALQKELLDYKNNSMYKTDLLEALKPEIQKSLAFLHDYKQFVARVKQNINVVLQERFPHEALEVQLEKASRSEAAIYWSAALMEDKLQIALLLTQPERLMHLPYTTFRLHGFVLKHLRIYQAAFDEKGIKVTHAGASKGEIKASQAFAVIPQTLLDNALKYSTRGSQVVVGFREDASSIDFSVTSSGPKIEAEEAQKIFEIFQRGAAGIAQEEEGSGIGLYLAQVVAKDLGTDIKMHQSGTRTKYGFETTFTVKLRRVD